MHIALVTRRFPPLIGGAEKMLSYLAEALADQGATVTVLTSRIDTTLPEVETPAPNLTIRRLRTSSLRFVGTWLYMRNLRNWFARHRVDLAYVSMLKHDAYVVLGAGRERRFPVVLRPEGAGATGDIAWQRWGRFGSKIAARCRQADAVVAISAAVRAELLADGYQPDQIVDLPNGVPIPSEPWTPPTNGHSAVFVGRLAEEKGLHALIDAWAIVQKQRPDARLTLVGDGPLRPALESQANRLNLGSTVTFAGASTAPEAHLRAADLFLLPSREEGMSIALLEAMALGMPIVASDIPGNRKLVTNGEHGRLAPPDDPIALAESILQAWNQPEASARMGEKARARAQAEYSIASVAKRHLDLFVRCVGPGSIGKDVL